jgi:hypothetical protein
MRNKIEHAPINPKSSFDMPLIILLFWHACVWLTVLYAHMTAPTPVWTASAKGQR